MSYSEQSDSSLEHGELDPSPDIHLDEEMDDDAGDRRNVERGPGSSPEKVDEDRLDIKPPPVKPKKDRHKDKRHKSDRRERDKNKESRSGRRVVVSNEPLRESTAEREQRHRDEDKRRERSRRERYRRMERLENLEREKAISERFERDRARRAEKEERRRREEHRERNRRPPSDKYSQRSRSPWRESTSSSRVESRVVRERSPVRQAKSAVHGPRTPPSMAQRDHQLEPDEESESSFHTEDERSEEEPEMDIHQHISSSPHSATESERSTESRSESEVEDRTEDGQKRGPSTKSKFDDRSEEDNESEVMSEKHSSPEEEAEYMDETPPQSPVELKPELPPYFPAIQGCRNVEEFHCLNRIEEGTYGVVYRARDKKTDEIVALKRLKMEKEKEGFPITSLREINTLLKAQHMNIVTVREIVVGSNMDKIFIVMDYVEHDLKSLMETMKAPFIVGEVKTLLLQLAAAVAHLHDNWILHRDLKTSNLLLSHKGILKVGDFGLAREYGSPLKQYTPIVVTLWYRSPELLLGCKEYSTAVDMWSVGCIMAEFLTMKPLFPGKSEIDQLNLIFKDLGTPNEKIWPGVKELPGMKKCTFTEHPYNKIKHRFGRALSENGFELLNKFLTYDPSKRISAEESKKHAFFTEEPRPVDPSMFPTWPAKSEQGGRTKKASSPKPPSGGKAYAKLLDDDMGLGFHMGGAHKGGVSQGGIGFSLKF